MKIKVLSFSLFIIVICFQAQANLYVATDGRDNGPGTFLDPYLTIQKAENNISAGDTVFVRAGTYRNSTWGEGDIWDGNNVIFLNVQGSPGNYITFMPYQDEEVILEFDDNYGIYITNTSYIKITGFTVKGVADLIIQTEAENAWGWYKIPDDTTVYDLAAQLGITISNGNYTYTSSGVSVIGESVDGGEYMPLADGYSKPNYYNGRAIVANNSHHIDITNNIVRDVPSAAIRAQQSDYVNIIGNKVYTNTYWTTLGVGAITVSEATVYPTGDTYTGVKIILEKNKVYNNENRMISWNPTKEFVHFEIDEGTGLFLTRNWQTYTHGQMRIANNISYSNGASGIVCHYTNNVIIEHNTCYNNATTNHGLPGGIGVNYSDDVIIRNNIAYSPSDKWALGVLAEPVTNLTVESNIIFNDNGAQSVYRTIDFGWTNTDPLFVNKAAFNLELTSGSLGVNAGTTNGTQTDDIDGNSRNDGSPDIGAYEYIIDQSVPVTLAFFTANYIPEGVILRWETCSEIENLGFIIERRQHSEVWKEIANFNSHSELKGQGTVSQKTEYSFIDKKVEPGNSYEYRLSDVDYSGNVKFHTDKITQVTVKSLISNILPCNFSLSPAYPNPFNPITTIRYNLPEQSQVTMIIYDLMGKQVKTIVNQVEEPGYKSIIWDATNNSGQTVSAGLYYYQINAGDFSRTKKMVLLK